MKEEDIEITLLHNSKYNETDNGFLAVVLINKKYVNILELSREQMLHIGAILLNAARKFINNSNFNNNDGTRKM